MNHTHPPLACNTPEARWILEHCAADIDRVALAFAGLPDEVLEPIVLEVCADIMEQIKVAYPDASADRLLAWGDGFNNAICARLDAIKAHGIGSAS